MLHAATMKVTRIKGLDEKRRLPKSIVGRPHLRTRIV